VLYPRIFEPEKYKKKNPSLVNAGPKALRYMMYLSSVASIKYNMQLRKCFLDRVSARMPVKKALIGVAVRIAKMLCPMLKRAEAFTVTTEYFSRKLSYLLARLLI
jgi:hypothetical protein